MPVRHYRETASLRTVKLFPQGRSMGTAPTEWADNRKVLSPLVVPESSKTVHRGSSVIQYWGHPEFS